MRLSLLVAVICGALLLAHYEADATYTVARTVYNMKSIRIASARIQRAVAVAESASRRVKRQSPQCITALTQAAENPTFQSCSRFLQNIGDFSQLTDAEIQSFCQSHCPAVLNKFYGMIKTACSGSEIPYVPAQFKLDLELLNQSCHHSVQDPVHYCIEDWIKVNQSLSSSDLAIYESCITGAKTSKDCPDACKQAIPFIQTQLGCCYRGLQDFELSKAINGTAISPEIYKRCNYEPPQLCKQ